MEGFFLDPKLFMWVHEAQEGVFLSLPKQNCLGKGGLCQESCQSTIPCALSCRVCRDAVMQEE